LEPVIFKSEDFEGPLDLLLHLISKNKLSIVDVSLAEITDQYFYYIERWKKENIDFSSEFLVIASELLYIKSKFLLPRHEEEMAEDDGTAVSLIDRLKEYKLIKLTADKIADRQFESKYTFFKIAEQIKFPSKPLAPMDKDRLLKSLFALSERKALLRPPSKENIKEAVIRKPVSIFSKVKDILKSIKRRTKMKYKDLFKGTRSERVASFLALLELIKLSKVKFYEEDDGITITDGEAK